MKFTKDHEWLKIDGDVATIGITKHAAEALGELVYVELPKIGNKYNSGDSFAVVESSKSASDVYIPVSGEVIETNEALVSSPELVNNSTYEDGWIAKVKLSTSFDESGLMSQEQYDKFLQE
jgi:glycine cleavage system H protein